jgi:hypothetical protein
MTEQGLYKILKVKYLSELNYLALLTMRCSRILCVVVLSTFATGFGFYPHFPFGPEKDSDNTAKDAFLDGLVQNMTIPELCGSW